jgi:hypothetical protein
MPELSARELAKAQRRRAQKSPCATRERQKICWTDASNLLPDASARQETARKSPFFNRLIDKNRKNPQKTCGNPRKPIDKPRLKADCELRYVFPHPHQYWRFRDSHLRGGSPES